MHHSMKRHFKLPGMRPFSVNSTYHMSQFGRHKTSGANEWTSQLFHKLNNQTDLKALAELRSAFDPSQHSYHVHLVWVHPEAELLTKKGQMSAKSVDLTNCEKLIVDCLFLPKHYNEATPYGLENLNIDDRYISRLTSEKAIGERAILVEIEIKPLLELLKV